MKTREEMKAFIEKKYRGLSEERKAELLNSVMARSNDVKNYLDTYLNK